VVLRLVGERLAGDIRYGADGSTVGLRWVGK
jgi:hypothetical protein